MTSQFHPLYAAIEEHLARCRAQVWLALEGLTDSTAGRRPAEGVWSAAENVDHLRILDRNVRRVLLKLAGHARDAGAGAEPESAASLETLLAKVRDAGESRERWTAPVIIAPSSATLLTDASVALRATRDAFLETLRGTCPLAAGVPTYAHPFLGPLNFYEWAVFLGAHELRHVDQIRRTRDALGI